MGIPGIYCIPTQLKDIPDNYCIPILLRGIQEFIVRKTYLLKTK